MRNILACPFIALVSPAFAECAPGYTQITVPLCQQSGGSARLHGMSLQGYEYNPGPGKTFNTDYFLPTFGEMDFYKGKGFNVVRIPFDIYRAQPTNFGPLDTTYMGRVTTLIDHGAAIGMSVVLDPHNQGNMWVAANAAFGRIGIEASNAMFADFWSRVATLYLGRINVLYGLMNEPSRPGVSATMWATSAKAAINAIRAVDASVTILIPGINFTGGHDWVTSGNAAAWTGFTDSGPFMFEMHEYLDVDFSGTHYACAAGYGSKLTDATNWLATNGYKGFLGEFDWWANSSGAIDAQCQQEAPVLMNALDAPQWGGWTGWGPGPAAGPNGPNLDPPNPAPQLPLLQAHIP